MHVHFSFHWKQEHRPVGWSYGYCPSCQQEGAIRVEQVLDVQYCTFLFFDFRIDEHRQGKSGRCDFCERQTELDEWAGRVKLEDWSPEEGLQALLARLEIPCPVEWPDPQSEVRLHSLLTSVQEQSSFSKLEISGLGALVGLPTGILGALLLTEWFPDTVLAVMIGAVVGMLVGTIAGAFLQRNQAVCKRMRTVCTRYRLDQDRLQQAAAKYNRRIRKAVQAVCRQAARSVDEESVPRRAGSD